MRRQIVNSKDRTFGSAAPSSARCSPRACVTVASLVFLSSPASAIYSHKAMELSFTSGQLRQLRKQHLRHSGRRNPRLGVHQLPPLLPSGLVGQALRPQRQPGELQRRRALHRRQHDHLRPGRRRRKVLLRAPDRGRQLELDQPGPPLRGQLAERRHLQPERRILHADHPAARIDDLQLPERARRRTGRVDLRRLRKARLAGVEIQPRTPGGQTPLRAVAQSGRLQRHRTMRHEGRHDRRDLGRPLRLQRRIRIRQVRGRPVHRPNSA